MLNELAKRCYEIAKSRGWHDKDVDPATALINISAEVSEAWEDYRNNLPMDKHIYDCQNAPVLESGLCGAKHSCASCEHGKPCGVPSEMADIIIRVLDTCHMYGIDIDKAFEEKCEFNKTRPYRHGGKRA